MTSRLFILLQAKTKKTPACIYKPKLYMLRDKKRQILGPFVLGHIDCDLRQTLIIFTVARMQCLS